jgi:hypothetical protein
VNQEDVRSICRTQAAAMLLPYHQALHDMLTELVAVLPEPGRVGREPYRQAVQRYTAKVLDLSASWSE